MKLAAVELDELDDDELLLFELEVKLCAVDEELDDELEELLLLELVKLAAVEEDELELLLLDVNDCAVELLDELELDDELLSSPASSGRALGVPIKLERGGL